MNPYLHGKYPKKSDEPDPRKVACIRTNKQMNKRMDKWKTLNSKAPVAEAGVQQLNETCYKSIY